MVRTVSDYQRAMRRWVGDEEAADE